MPLPLMPAHAAATFAVLRFYYDAFMLIHAVFARYFAATMPNIFFIFFALATTACYASNCRHGR